MIQNKITRKFIFTRSSCTIIKKPVKEFLKTLLLAIFSEIYVPASFIYKKHPTSW